MNPLIRHSLDSSEVKRPRNYCKTARAALVCSLLTTPLTTLPLLQLADQQGSFLNTLAGTLPYTSLAAIVGSVLIGLPSLAICIALIAIQRVHSSWTPIGGAIPARAALVIAIISLIASVTLFLSGIL